LDFRAQSKTLEHDIVRYRHSCPVLKYTVFGPIMYKLFKKSLKIPKGKSESVNRRITDNTMAKRKRTKNDLQNTHIKLKIE
jgi:hypothetical protein